MNSRAHGATVGGTKALGGWNESGSFRNCYDRAFPIDALLGAASFNARRPEEYYVPRDDLRKSFPKSNKRKPDLTISSLAEPPADCLAYLFPWVEPEMAALETRMSASRLNRDIALKQFLVLLQWLRVVLLQDCALLYARYPMCPIFRFAPFTFPSFATFSANATAVVTAAEETARLAFHNLPDHMARSMRGYATDLQMKQEQNHSKVCDELRELREQNARLELLLSNKGSRKSSKAKNGLSPSLSCSPSCGPLTQLIPQYCLRRPLLHHLLHCHCPQLVTAQSALTCHHHLFPFPPLPSISPVHHPSLSLPAHRLLHKSRYSTR
jgi:hypothetical protein